MEEVGATVNNGSTKGDWDEKLTYVGEGSEEGGGSLLHLIIEIEDERGHIVRELKVNARSESDHLPVELRIGGGNRAKREKKKKECLNSDGQIIKDKNMRREWKRKGKVLKVRGGDCKRWDGLIK